MTRRFKRASLLVAFLLLSGCSGSEKVERVVTYPARVETIDRQVPFLKAHLRDGKLILFSKWAVDSVARAVEGVGEVFDPNRLRIDSAPMRLSVDSVALFETNVIEPSGGIGSLSVMTAVSVAISVACLSNPKACFGSCPTFYLSDGSTQSLQAEGFSASILPVLEATDIDALYRAHPNGRDVQITMKNEAYETHVVRSVNLLAVPRQGGQRAFATPEGSFWNASNIIPVSDAAGPGDRCTEALRSFDGNERYSTTDSSDLAAREKIVLDFHNVPAGKTGLILAVRQTLLSTYLFYQTLSYLGKSAGEYLAVAERGDQLLHDQLHQLGNLVGGIKVYVKSENGSLQFVQEMSETGPLATDSHFILLPDTHREDVTVVLDMVRGAWRIDWTALAAVDREVTPMRIQPSAVLHDEKLDDASRDLLRDPRRTLVTYPGDEYTLVYHLPDDAHYELFLESRGYYLEWMREEWYKEENPARAALLFSSPEEALKIMAPEFKQVESTMETLFWNSKYVRK